MIITSFFIPFLLPTRNELEAARGRVAVAKGTGDRSRWNAYNAKKRQAQADVVAHILSQRVPRLQFQPLKLRFFWRCPSRLFDPDNIADGGRKIILDAMKPTRRGPDNRGNVGAGIIHCDGWHCIRGFSDEFVMVADAHPQIGVRVELEAAP